jgi:hypothetical protein
MNRFLITACLAAAVIVGIVATTTRAEDIAFTYKKIVWEYVEQPDKGITFGGDSTFPALPADFFDPGSEPFDGKVLLTNVPGSGTAMPTFRMSGAVFPGPQAGGTEDINIGIGELQEATLQLVSTEPILVTYSGGATEEWVVRVNLNPQETGDSALRVSHDGPGEPDGGTILPVDSFFDVFAELTFTNTPAGGGPRHRFFSIVDRTNLSNLSKWAHQNDNIAGGADREFIPGADPGNPLAPLETLFFEGGGISLPLRVADVQVPEPSTLLLAIVGLVGLVLARRQRRSSRS